MLIIMKSLLNKMFILSIIYFSGHYETYFITEGWNWSYIIKFFKAQFLLSCTNMVTFILSLLLGLESKEQKAYCKYSYYILCLLKLSKHFHPHTKTLNAWIPMKITGFCLWKFVELHLLPEKCHHFLLHICVSVSINFRFAHARLCLHLVLRCILVSQITNKGETFLSRTGVLIFFLRCTLIPK